MIPNQKNESYFIDNPISLNNAIQADKIKDKKEELYSEPSSLTKRKIIDITDSTAATDQMNSNFKSIASSTLLHLCSPYKDIESHRVTIVTPENVPQRVHLYPTKKVMQIYSSFLKQKTAETTPQSVSSGTIHLPPLMPILASPLNRMIPDANSSPDTIERRLADTPSNASIASFDEFISVQPAKHMKIDIEEDTTYYIEREQIERQINCSIRNNALVRSGGYPWKYQVEYMFVIDQNNNLLIQEKKRKGKHGRIHHSSLTHGSPVKTAGVVTVLNDKTFVFENLSGHYKPPQESLDGVIAWFQQKGASIKKIGDKVKFNPVWQMKSRQLIIELQ